MVLVKKKKNQIRKNREKSLEKVEQNKRGYYKNKEELH